MFDWVIEKFTEIILYGFVKLFEWVAVVGLIILLIPAAIVVSILYYCNRDSGD